MVYTGKDTRAVMNTGGFVGQKMGRIEWEVNRVAKVSHGGVEVGVSVDG